MATEQLRRRRADGPGTNGSPLPFAGLEDDKKDRLGVEQAAAPQSLGAKVLPWAVPLALTGLAFFTRLWNITWSQHVVWDEAHFGKFASYYLKREFYFDVHPPLGKMLLAFAGILAGYDGSFDFESGKKYPDGLHYGVMRVFCGIFGALMVPLAYFTAIELGLSKKAATLAGSMVLMDIAYIAITRFILLDSMLLFFTVLSIYCLACFRATEDKPGPFTFEWWYWMLMTGLSLGCVLSVKWVGLFAIGVVGLYTIEDLWRLLGDKTISMKQYLLHWAARIVCLIAVPAAVYLLCFVIHFAILNRSGTGDANMSSLFQAGLKGIDLDSNPLQVVYGSKATIKNNGHGGGLLHSHVQRYPTGSEQQQVTCYHHKDSNNDWIFMRDWDRTRATGLHPDQEEITPIRNGDVIRIFHEQTGRNLHSHNHKAPVTVKDNEVSCYGNSTIGDQNDHWKVEIVDDAYDRNPTEIHALTTRFRLRHNSGCLLKGHNVNLPQWGFKQLEVTCDKHAKGNERNVIWNVERHINPRLPAGNGKMYRSTFFKDFIDHNVGMWTTNNALTPDPDKEPDQLVSTPPQWPLLLVGLRMCGWGDSEIKFYLLGTPIIWWSGAAALVIFVLMTVTYLILWQRNAVTWTPAEKSSYFFGGLQVCFLGWLLHYIPFFIMGRVTYLHHYFPALYFAILMFAFVVDHISTRYIRSEIGRSIVFGTLLLAVTANFWYFKDLALGFNVPAKEYSGRRWLPTWNIHD